MGINGTSVNYTQNGVPKTGLSGEFVLNSDLPLEPFGYCVEQGVSIWGGTFNILNLRDLDGFYVNAGWLVDTYYYDINLTENYQRAALQLAVWDVISDGLIDDIINISDASTQTYFTNIQNYYEANYDPSSITGKGYKIAELQYQYASGATLNVQDLIVRPVPEPATMMLFGLGLLGISALGRKKE
jgi:hypothetical protein